MSPTNPTPVKPREILRAKTASLHQQTEQHLDWGSIFSSREGYGRFLQTMFRITAGADQAVERQWSENPPAWFADRRTSAWVAADLEQLQLAAPTEQADFQFADSPPKVAGVLYVLEGSALGGAILAKRLEQQLHISAENGGKYLNGYGKRTGEHWRQVIDWLDQVLAEPASLDAAIDAARQTFDLYAQQLQGAAK